MAQYIDKDAVLAEIERLKKELQDKGKTNNFIAVEIFIMNYFLCFINSLEMKDVDLDSEATHYLLYEHRSPLNEIMHKVDLKSEMQYHKDIENAFKAGFELGMAVGNKT